MPMLEQLSSDCILIGVTTTVVAMLVTPTLAAEYVEPTWLRLLTDSDMVPPQSNASGQRGAQVEGRGPQSTDISPKLRRGTLGERAAEACAHA